MLVRNVTDARLLGVAKYSTGSDLSLGDIIAEHTCNLLESWNCETERVIKNVFVIKSDQLLFLVIQYFMLVLQILITLFLLKS